MAKITNAVKAAVGYRKGFLNAAEMVALAAEARNQLKFARDIRDFAKKNAGRFARAEAKQRV